MEDSEEDGGAEGSRTPDLRNAIAALSQLSYGPEDTVAAVTPKPLATPTA
jgi:hypothetical protein